jgi:signal peptidase I
MRLTSPLRHPDPGAAAPEPSSVKETVISVIIAFALAFVFRGFVIEAFLIPTGSMAPTLRGAHMSFKSPQSGYEWAVTPWQYVDQMTRQIPQPIQTRIEVHDPMTGWDIRQAEVPRSWGDRIFVMKYLYSIYDPERFDVVVFKNPRDPTVNYIKRLIGLPNQMIALIDGDVFYRNIENGDLDANGRPTMDDPWALPGWHVARKPEQAQRAMWQLVFSSEYSPIAAVDSSTNRRWFIPPWKAAGAAKDWKIDDRTDYAYTGDGPTILEWDAVKHPIEDFYSYNEGTRGMVGPYPVSDIRLSLGIRPTAQGERVSAIVTARGYDFRGEVEGSSVSLSMRPVDPAGVPKGDWDVKARVNLPAPLPVGKVTNIDFWHVDQSLKMFIDDKLIAQADYDWTPEQRLINSTSMNLDQVMANPLSLVEFNGAALPVVNRAQLPVYTRPKARFEFSGGSFTLYRVALSRDIYYQPAQYPDHNDAGLPHSHAGKPALGTHPTSTIILNKDQFFVCGDNSPQSLDARLWDAPNPWVAEIDPKMGVVNRDLVIGKAFFVYFPAPKRRGSMPLPDCGSMRFIW